MILYKSKVSQRSLGRRVCYGIASSYHRLVKTTPKPRATKKSSGELVGPPPPLFELPEDEVVAAGTAALVELGAMDVVDD